MTRLLVLGQPFTGSRIALALNNPSAGGLQASYVAQGDYLRLLARPPRPPGGVILMRVGYRVGAASSRGRLFDAFWSRLRQALPRAAACHYWIGTDVLDTVEATRAGTLRQGALERARHDLHLSVAPWLTSELETVGLHAVTALLPSPTRAPDAAPPMPSEFRVLTYVPAARFDFYGGSAIVEAARRLPEIGFDVVGPGDPPGSAPANIRWHGWVSDMATRYAEASVVVRIPRHDGFGNTVIEGLLHARHVVYTHALPHVLQLSSVTPGALAETLQDLHRSHVMGVLSRNDAGREYALATFDEPTLVAALTDILRGVA